MPISVCGEQDFLNCGNSISETDHQKSRAPRVRIAHGFVCKLDADSVPLIMKMIQLFQWGKKEEHWQMSPNRYSIRDLSEKGKEGNSTTFGQALSKHAGAIDQQATVATWRFIYLLQKCLCGLGGQ